MESMEKEGVFPVVEEEGGAAFPGLAESGQGAGAFPAQVAAFQTDAELLEEEEEIDELGVALAQGLPDWDIEPPHMAVRRRKV